MEEAVSEEDYDTFFEYMMDQYSKSGIVGRETTKAIAEFGEKIFAMVVDNLSNMVEAALRRNSHSLIYIWSLYLREKIFFILLP